MKIKNIQILLLAVFFFSVSCGSDFIDLEPRGQELESNYYKTEDEVFEALVATYDVLQWGGTAGAWTMKVGLLNAASDDTFAGGSDSGDQPSWVAWDDFTLDPFIGPQQGLWNKGFAGIYRANLVLQKLEEAEGFSETFTNRTAAEAKFLRAFYYFDLVRLFGDVPLLTTVLSGDEIYEQTRASKSEIYALIEQDLQDAKATFELPATVPPNELGRVTQGAISALLGKVILFQNDESRMGLAAGYFDEVINSMRDFVGPTYATGWSFCPVTQKLVDILQNDPRFEHTIIDGNLLKLQGASYTEGFQNTDYFIRKYAPLADESALDGEPALNWSNNVREIRYADVLLMAAEAFARSGDETKGKQYLNQVRQRVNVQPLSGSGQVLLDRIYRERQRELATEGHRFFDLVRTGKAAEELEDRGFTPNKNELLPIPQAEIDITEGLIIQNPGY